MEEFRDVVGYEGLYQVSNLGNVKSLKFGKGRVLKELQTGLKKNIYLAVALSKDGKGKQYKIHQLVAMAFLNHTPCGNELVVDHINDDKLDNRLENLQIVSHRFNTYKTQGRHTSKYKGVSLHKKLNKWVSNIMINGKSNHLGVFNCELAAAAAYQNKLKEITNK